MSSLPDLPADAIPFWRESTELSSYPTLEHNLDVDVIIVGGGITGLTAVEILSKEKLNVALIEASRFVSGTTGHTTAKVTAQHGLIYDELINKHGVEPARKYYEANKNAIRYMKELIEENQIDCDFEQQDAFLYATTGEYANKLETEYKAYDQLNIKGDLTTKIPMDLTIENALSMKNQYQFHPVKYLKHIINLVDQRGVKLFENTSAVDIQKDDKRVTIKTENGKEIKANYVLICSHFPFYEGKALWSTRIYPERSYALSIKANKPYPGGMYLKTDTPKRSIRYQPTDDGELYIIGGENHKTGQGQDMMEHFKALRRFADELFDDYEILNRWSAQDLTSMDKVPYIGPMTKDNPNILIATGYRKWGMTNGTVAAKLLSDLVLGEITPYADLFKPSRFEANPSIQQFVKENVNVAKELVKGKMDRKNNNIDELNNDEATTFRMDGGRKGAYRDSSGELHIVDTTCTHAGCEVNWNSGEKSWDCPCHGSRFSYTGEVLEGPAKEPLQKHDHTMLDSLMPSDWKE
ncbi:FAD-dependent oxidoreductase [Allobacillus sp. GCM10007489]|uniref:FAD-dependent oxidoreductase n=1 Tax=unclassified Allobacillus TaxID=2628859 RepID=UPI0021028661|nr:FAD-dependent oxidoreductase [Allobacillus sp. SKP2-8]